MKTSMKKKFQITVNQESKQVEAFSMERLLDVLREDFHLTGTKEGCGEGECGACSVIMNGRLVNSCLIPMAQAEGATIETVEGLSNSELHPVQEGFLKCGGAQCGICTPGMLMASVDLLRKNSNPEREEIRQALGGNLCRCTGYVKIYDSVEEAARICRTKGVKP